jgi:hypothetical protein
MSDKAIRAAKLTLGAVLDKRHARTAVERAQGQIAPSKYLPGVPRQFHADGGNVDDPQPAAPPPVDLGQAREQKQLRTFHSGLMGDIQSSMSAMQKAHQKALDAGVFDGYEVGDVLQGSAHPMRITGRFVRPWKPNRMTLEHFDRMGAKPTIIEHNGKQYIPMLRYQTGREGVDGFQEGDAYLDGVKAAGYRKMGGLRAVKADGGSVDDEDEGIDAYHGSPHDFDAFDISKLGTGEGQQAYGHGLYFAGNEGIAKYYRDTLRSELPLVHIDGKNTGKRISESDYHVQNMIRNLMTPEQYHEHLLNSPNYASLQKAYADASDVDEGLGVTDKDVAQWEIEDFHKKLNEIKGYFGKKVSAFVPSGHMYKVKLNVKPHELLDWDAPLSDQPAWQKVRQHWDDTKGDPDIIAQRLGLDESSTGRQLHEALSGYDRSGQAKAASALSAAGLKGIRYRDASSRGDDKDGDPTHNYVMFHHDPVKVVDKYEYGGMVEKSGGGPMGDDDDDKPVDLGFARAMRRFNQTDSRPPPEVEGIFNRLAAAKDAAADAHEAAHKAGAFDSVQIGDVFKYKPLDTYAPMKVIGHGMVPVERWGGINPPKYVYKGHFPVAHVEYQDARKERRSPAIELLEDRNLYDFVSGKPRIARADGGRLNLYSKAARIIAGMKNQPMQAADIVKYALSKGAKKTEMAHVDVPPGKATPKQVADHIEFMQPQIGVHRREGGDFRFSNSNDYLREMDRLHDNGMHDEAERLYEEFERFEGHGPADKPIYARFQLGGDKSNYREHILTLDSHEGPTFMARDHWGNLKNPLAHIRMSDRIINGKKILHIEELQSDWNNHARKRGFSDGSEKRALDEFVQGMRQKAIAGIDPTASPMIRQALQQKYGAMDPHTLAQKLGGDHFDRLTDLKYNTMPEKMGAPRAPYINPDRDDASEVAMKHILMEAAKGGYDGIAFTPDEEQEERWPGNTFNGIYNKKLPGMAQRLVQQHDPETDPDDMTRLQGWAVPRIPLSDKARDSIMQNGFSSFRRGGAVGYGGGGNVGGKVVKGYHGSPNDFDQFDPSMAKTAKYHYIAETPETARLYGKNVYHVSVHPKNMVTFDPEGIMPKHMRVVNELAQRLGYDPEELLDHITGATGSFYGAKGSLQDQVMDELKDMGHDAVQFPDAIPGGGWEMSTVALDPSIIKINKKDQYRRGGAVDAALAATRRFTKDGKAATMALKPKGK